MNNKILIIISLLLAILGGYFFFSNSNSTINKKLVEFAVEDTSQIAAIEIVGQNEKLLLQRNNLGFWYLNNFQYANHKSVRILLKTLKNLQMKSPVSSEIEQDIKNELLKNGKKLTVFFNDSTQKIIYIGGADANKTGTYMMLQSADKPFVVHIAGYPFDLSVNFNTAEHLWRDKIIFNIESSNIQYVKIEDFFSENNSFELKVQDNNFKLTSLLNNVEIQNFRKEKVETFLSNFLGIELQSFDSGLSQSEIDSLLNEKPAYLIDVKTSNNQQITTKLFFMKNTAQPKGYDLDKMYCFINKDIKPVVVTFFAFDPILKKIDYFL